MGFPHDRTRGGYLYKVIRVIGGSLNKKRHINTNANDSDSRVSHLDQNEALFEHTYRYIHGTMPVVEGRVSRVDLVVVIENRYDGKLTSLVACGLSQMKYPGHRQISIYSN